MSIVHDLRDTAGLCATCRHMRRVSSRRGSVFFLCERANSDSRYARYPKLPVVRCPGFELASTQAPGPGASGSDE
jgi:hypothetical protein